MRRNQLIKSSPAQGKTGANGDKGFDVYVKPEVRDSAFRPEASSHTNRVRDVLEKKKEHRLRELNQGWGSRLKKCVFYIFSPVQGENFTPTNPWVAHPTSIAASTMLIVSGLLLIYSAIQVPLDIGFYWNTEVCQTSPVLIKFNVFVDTFFVFEIMFNFIVGTWYKGAYQEKMLTIAWIYVKSRFFFDAITSVPTSWIELMAWQSCGKEDATAIQSSAVSDAMKFLRLLKPLRLTKLLRIIKFAKIFDILDRILRISPQVLQIAKLIFGVALLVHFLSCIFWLLKTEYDPNFKDFVEVWEVGNSVSKKWLLAMYFVNTVFTTVGFGDISGTNDVERAFCIIVMWVGTAVFAVIINKLQVAAAEMNERNREKNQEITKVVRFMREHKAPAWMEQEVRTWLSFHIDRMTAKHERHQVLWSLPPKLRNQVMLQINSRAFRNSWVFARLTHSDATNLVTELVLHTSNYIIAKGQLICSDKIHCALPKLPVLEEEEAEDTGGRSKFAFDSNLDSNSIVRHQSLILEPEPVEERPPRPEDQMLYIVEVGAVVATVWLKGESSMIESKMMTKGHFFGERRLLFNDGDTGKGGWGFDEEVEFEFRAVENSEIITLTKETFQDVVSKFPPKIVKEIEYESNRMWGAADPHIEDLRLQIELAKIGNDSEEFAKSRRARLRWEQLGFRLIANRSKDVAMSDLLFNFSVPTKTADPVAALRARPDWSSGSLRNSRRNSQSWRPNTRNSSFRVNSRGSQARKTGSMKSNALSSGSLRSNLQVYNEEEGTPRRVGSGTRTAEAHPPHQVVDAQIEGRQKSMETADDKVERGRRRSLVSSLTSMLSRQRGDRSKASPEPNGADPVVSANFVMLDSPVHQTRPHNTPAATPIPSSAGAAAAAAAAAGGAGAERYFPG